MGSDFVKRRRASTENLVSKSGTSHPVSKPSQPPPCSEENCHLKADKSTEMRGTIHKEYYRPQRLETAMVLLASPDAPPTREPQMIRLVATPIVNGKPGASHIVQEYPLMVIAPKEMDTVTQDSGESRCFAQEVDGRVGAVPVLCDRHIRMSRTGVPNPRKPPDFQTNIEEIFTRHQCNDSHCHGGVKGRGGFKLSHNGLDPHEDYQWIVRAVPTKYSAPSPSYP